jgi:hypothetical protein
MVKMFVSVTLYRNLLRKLRQLRSGNIMTYTLYQIATVYATHMRNSTFSTVAMEMFSTDSCIGTNTCRFVLLRDGPNREYSLFILLQ